MVGDGRIGEPIRPLNCHVRNRRGRGSRARTEHGGDGTLRLAPEDIPHPGPYNLCHEPRRATKCLLLFGEQPARGGKQTDRGGGHVQCGDSSGSGLASVTGDSCPVGMARVGVGRVGGVRTRRPGRVMAPISAGSAECSSSADGGGTVGIH